MSYIDDKNKPDITGLETFFSQYKYHAKLTGIKSTMGNVDRSCQYPVLRQVFLDKDIDTIKELIHLLYIEHKTNKALSEIIKLSNLLIKLTETIQEGTSIKINISDLPYQEIGVGYYSPNFYYFYGEIYKNYQSKGDDATVLQNDLNLAEKIEDYFKTIDSPSQVTIECVRDYLLSQFIFGELDLLRIMINCTSNQLYSFSEYLNKMGSYQRIPTSQLLNGYVVKFTANLIYILGKVISEQEIPLFTVINKIISQHNSYQEFDLLDKVRELDFTLDLGIYKPSAKEPVNSSCIYTFEPCTIAYLINSLVINEREHIRYLNLSRSKKDSSIAAGNTLSVVAPKDYSSNTYTLYRIIASGDKYKVIDFSLNGMYPDFTQKETLPEDEVVRVLDLGMGKNLQVIDVIYLYMSDIYSRSILARALDASKVKEFSSAYIDFVKVMKDLFDGKVIENGLLIDTFQKVAKFYGQFDCSNNEGIVKLNNQITRELSDIGTLSIAEMRNRFDIDYNYSEHRNLYLFAIENEVQRNGLYQSPNYDFKPYLNKKDANLDLVKLFTNVSTYYKQLMDLTLVFVHLASLAKEQINENAKLIIDKQNS